MTAEQQLLQYALAITLAATSCAPAPPTAGRTPPPAPAPARAPIRDATADAAPASSTATPPAPAAPPACMPRALTEAGRLLAARIDPDQNLEFCVRVGIGSEAPTRCLGLSFEDGRFRGLASVWPSFSFATAPERSAPNTAHATLGSNGGTLDVCHAAQDCFVVRVAPPKPDAFDEVFASLPAIGVPGSSVVVVARAEERWTQQGVLHSNLLLESFDTKRRSKLRAASVAKDEWPTRMFWLGQKLLLVSCAREGVGCAARVVDPKNLAARRLPVTLESDSRQSGGDAGGLEFEDPSGRRVLVDRSGSHLIWVGRDGKLERRVELWPAGSQDSFTCRAGLRNDRELVVLRAGPHADSVALVGLDDAKVGRFEAPACP